MPILFTADDAGASPEVNEAIRRACTEGAVNSVAYLVNLPWFDDAVDRLSETGTGKSLHLNLVEGRPLVLDNTSPLVANGFFRYQSGDLLAAYYLGGTDARSRIRADIHLEITAQMSAFGIAFGSDTPLAVDSHQHVHMFPFVLPEVLAAARELNLKISRLRWPAENPKLHKGMGAGESRYLWSNFTKVLALRVMAWTSRRQLTGSSAGVDSVTTAFCGVLHTGHMTFEVARAFVDGLSDTHVEQNVAELLIHPGGGKQVVEAWQRSAALQEFYTSPWRERELALACDPRMRALLSRTR